MSTYNNTRFTLMAFPQKVTDSGRLYLNILFIPRNISPLELIDSNFPVYKKVEPFYSVNPPFQVVIVNNPDNFPGYSPAIPDERVLDIAPGDIAYSDDRYNIFDTLKNARDGNGKLKYFDIDETRSSNVSGSGSYRANKAILKENSVRKYLPVTYRKAFNFTSPRTPNAVMDDSYHCAMREQKPAISFSHDNKVSWGKVYAHLLRQPKLAKAAGLLYETSVQLKVGDLSDGGWIYITIPSGTYGDALQASVNDPDGPFIKRYAARIPLLKSTEPGKPFKGRDLFAAVLFPVVNPLQVSPGIFDEVFMEASTFDEGFATIVHANQPVSQNLLKEKQDGIHPQKDIGIRLGWEDEQILIWYMRQMSKDENIAGNERLDSPLGVNGYHIDVRMGDLDPWESLNAVESKEDIFLENIPLGSFKGELPYQVFPSKSYDGEVNSDYWLPMYYANWNNASLVLPDQLASELDALDYDHDCIDPETNDPVKRRVNSNSPYDAQKVNTKLQYGKTYQFRVRMSDISGGGPAVESPMPDDTPGRIAKVHFKRYIAPNALQILNPFFRNPNVAGVPGDPDNNIYEYNNGINFSGETITVKRPLLGYPAVVYTGKYPQVEDKLLAVKQQVLDNGLKQVIGLNDPDVDRVEIKVEVESLQMDNLASDNGRENYITLYTANRSFNEVDFEEARDIHFKYIDCPVLNLEDQSQPFTVTDEGVDCNLAILSNDGSLYLPTSRNIRLTLRAVGKGDNSYWNVNKNGIQNLDSRYGKVTVLMARKNSRNEIDLFSGENSSKVLQGIYLQPDPVSVKLNPVKFKKLLGGMDGMPDIVHRFAKQLDIECKDLTLTSKNGERLVFWCSNFIRHSMAPDNSSITFDTKNELTGHWLVCTDINLKRDWTWDGLELKSMIIERRRCWGSDNEKINNEAFKSIGDLEIKRIASYQAIQKAEDDKIHRDHTRIIVIDVIDPKPVNDGQGGTDEFYPYPDCILVQYKLIPKLLPYAGVLMPAKDADQPTDVIELPITINPKQTPRLLSAGIALSPYIKNDKYSSTEARKRYLWFEFDRNPADPHDDLFCRMLAYAPDQLISNNHPDLMAVPDEPPLPLDPEYIRVVIPGPGHDNSGLNAMQKMEKSIDDGRPYYLLPVPPALHPESPEMFGMFTYEFRYGHSGDTWSTAQGRFGRALRVAGVQHPAPTLLCTVQHDEHEITVSAPYAKAVFNGKNVTSKPPRTSMWCLLYAQVMQADGKEYRNILLDNLELKPRILGTEMEKLGQEIGLLDNELPKEMRKNPANAEMMKSRFIQLKKQIEMLPMEIRSEEETGYRAYGRWISAEVRSRLALYGLPANSPLSLVCVEVFGQITNIFDHINDFNKVEYINVNPDDYRTRNTRSMKDNLISKVRNEFDQETADTVEVALSNIKDYREEKLIDPMNSQLGLHRILRTSPLTEVPPICCKPDCD